MPLGTVVGPTGPTGPTGPIGPTGPTGDPGIEVPLKTSDYGDKTVTHAKLGVAAVNSENINIGSINFDRLSDSAVDKLRELSYISEIYSRDSLSGFLDGIERITENTTDTPIAAPGIALAYAVESTGNSLYIFVVQVVMQVQDDNTLIHIRHSERISKPIQDVVKWSTWISLTDKSGQLDYMQPGDVDDFINSIASKTEVQDG